MVKGHYTVKLHGTAILSCGEEVGSSEKNILLNIRTRFAHLGPLEWIDIKRVGELVNFRLF